MSERSVATPNAGRQERDFGAVSALAAYAVLLLPLCQSSPAAASFVASQLNGGVVGDASPSIDPITAFPSRIPRRETLYREGISLPARGRCCAQASGARPPRLPRAHASILLPSALAPALLASARGQGVGAVT
jgi:hypothetical protein